jgi:hypothetical protein
VNDWDDFEFDQVAPIQNPGLEQDRVFTFDELETPSEIGLNPALNVRQTFRHHSAPIRGALIDRRRVLIPVPFDDHEEHGSSV